MQLISAVLGSLLAVSGSQASQKVISVLQAEVGLIPATAQDFIYFTRAGIFLVNSRLLSLKLKRRVCIRANGSCLGELNLAAKVLFSRLALSH